MLPGTGGCGGQGGRGSDGQAGSGGAGYFGPAVNLDGRHESNSRFPLALSDINGGFRGGFVTSDGDRWGGLGGGGGTWYANGAGGGYSGGGGCGCYGKSGGGGSFVAMGVEGLKEIEDRCLMTPKKTGGTVTLTGPAEVAVVFSSKGRSGCELPTQNDVQKTISVLPNGVQVYEIEHEGCYQIVVAGAGGVEGEGAQLSIEFARLGIGDSFGVLVGQRASDNDCGGGGSIVWLCRSSEDQLSAALVPDRAELALRLLSDSAGLSEDVLDALLTGGPASKWANLVCDDSTICQEVVKSLVALDPALEKKMYNPDVILAALIPKRAVTALRLLRTQDGAKAFNDDVCRQAVQDDYQDDMSRLQLLVSDPGEPIQRKKSQQLIDLLVETNPRIAGPAVIAAAKLTKTGLEAKPVPRPCAYEVLVSLLSRNAGNVLGDENRSDDWVAQLERTVVDLVSIKEYEKTIYLLDACKIETSIGLIRLLLEPRKTAAEGTWWHTCMVAHEEAKDFVGRVVMSAQKLAQYSMIDGLRARDALIQGLDPNCRQAYSIATPIIRTAIDEAIYFCGRYRLEDAVVHQSATSIVRAATDVKTDSRVVIKFMRHEDQFVNEKETRNELMSRSDGADGCDGERLASSIVPILLHSESPELEPRWVPDALAMLDCDMKFGVVMPCGDRNLAAIYMHERPPLNACRSLMEEIFKAVGELHSRGVVHGDLKQLNIVRIIDGASGRADFRLIDLDAAVRCHGDFVGVSRCPHLAM